MQFIRLWIGSIFSTIRNDGNDDAHTDDYWRQRRRNSNKSQSHSSRIKESKIQNIVYTFVMFLNDSIIYELFRIWFSCVPHARAFWCFDVFISLFGRRSWNIWCRRSTKTSYVVSRGASCKFPSIAPPHHAIHFYLPFVVSLFIILDAAILHSTHHTSHINNTKNISASVCVERRMAASLLTSFVYYSMLCWRLFMRSFRHSAKSKRVIKLICTIEVHEINANEFVWCSCCALASLAHTVHVQ